MCKCLAGQVVCCCCSCAWNILILIIVIAIIAAIAIGLGVYFGVYHHEDPDVQQQLEDKSKQAVDGVVDLFNKVGNKFRD